MRSQRRHPREASARANGVRLEETSVDRLLRDAREAVAETNQLQAKIVAQRQKTRARKEELETLVTIEVESDMGRLRQERESLQVLVAEQLRLLESLEQQVMELGELKLQRNIRAAQLKKFLQPFGGTAVLYGRGRTEPRCTAMSTELKELRFEADELDSSAKQMEAQGRELTRRITEAHERKDHLESQIMTRRHASAVTEALYRGRLDEASTYLSAVGDRAGWSERTSSSWFQESGFASYPDEEFPAGDAAELLQDEET